jgi:biopolymer transport protein ExbD
MRFIDRKRARPVIPLVSLIDILTILLLFFIVASEFRKEEEKGPNQERRLDIALPGVSEMEGQPADDPRASISLTSEGAILLDGQPVTNPEELVERLRARRDSNPAEAFELEPDENVPLGKLIAVWDALVKAGIPVAEVPARVLKKP